MIEAVENQWPEVIVIDEIGTEREGPRRLAPLPERGVQRLATAHANELANLIDTRRFCEPESVWSSDGHPGR